MSCGRKSYHCDGWVGGLNVKYVYVVLTERKGIGDFSQIKINDETVYVKIETQNVGPILQELVIPPTSNRPIEQ